MDAFNSGTYLEKIKYHKDVQLTETGLRSLHRHQMFAIPFENFDVSLGRPILLDPASLTRKLVNSRRGGYCFELNGLFLHALTCFGFNARALLARVHLHGTPSGRGHQVSLVTINDRQWLTDVGFGSHNMRAPILLERNRETTCDNQTLRLIDAKPFGTMMQTLSEEGWQNLYSFDMEYVGPADIKQGNYFSSTHPDSIFSRNRIASLQTEKGRITLLNRRMKIVVAEKTRTLDLPEDQRYLDALQAHFGIELEVAYETLPQPSDGNIVLDGLS